MNHHHTSPPSLDQFFTDDTTEENFPIAPLDDDVWPEDQISDRQLCIHDAPQQKHLYDYPYPYANLNIGWNLPLSLTPDLVEFEYDIIDLMDTHLKDIMSITSVKDIPDFEEISDHPEYSQLEAWFA